MFIVVKAVPGGKGKTRMTRAGPDINDDSRKKRRVTSGHLPVMIGVDLKRQRRNIGW